ncbi:hypothetical protein [Streptomyces sp. NPDC093097]|uniref:hypothetical protein n=1 Tax=Streptomyces sp. NPDC093097 TaxID=3366027 RepID=UPI003800150D
MKLEAGGCQPIQPEGGKYFTMGGEGQVFDLFAHFRCAAQAAYVDAILTLTPRRRIDTVKKWFPVKYIPP